MPFRGILLSALMLLIAVALALTGGLPQSIALTAAKMIVLFFGYEVAVAELRGRLGFVGGATVASLAVLAVRSLIG
jgi:UDP-GlcNAc:undecaprenyl-phosphate GlcNAc-1-phosphate transferase